MYTRALSTIHCSPKTENVKNPGLSRNCINWLLTCCVVYCLCFWCVCSVKPVVPNLTRTLFILCHIVIPLFPRLSTQKDAFWLTWDIMQLSVLLLGRLLRVDLMKCISNVCPSVRPKKFLWFQWNWYVGRGRRVMHDGMQYDPIQGQGHEPSKVWNLAIFNDYLLLHL